MPRGHFMVLHAGGGGHLSTAQDNVSKVIKTNETGIVRGSLLYLDSSDEWNAAAADVATQGDNDNPGPILHFALQDQDQPDVVMSGKLTALPCTPSFPFETNQFDTAPTWAIGMYAMGGADAKLTEFAAGNTAVAIVTKLETPRWINDLLSADGQRTGGKADVMQFRAVYLPQLAPSA